MKTFTVPTRAEVSAPNQAIFDTLQKGLGLVPNLYAYLAKNETALGDYLTLENRKTTLNKKEQEVINLAVSQVNECDYCLAAHTVIGKMTGFSDEQIAELRSGTASFDQKLSALATFAKEVVVRRGKPAPQVTEQFFAAGYTEANLIDVVLLVGDRIISNYLHGITGVTVDFPAAPPLQNSVTG